MAKNLTAPSRARSHRTLCFAVAALATAGSPLVHAQAGAPARPATAPMASPAPAAHFAIRGFKVTGDNPLGQAETAQVLAPYVRSDATIDTLQQATAALEAELRKRGFGLHRVALPPQEVGDTVTLNIVTFTIGQVQMEGRQIYSEANVRRSVPELQEGRTPNFKKLAVQTAIANENPNKQIQVGIRESDEPDKINANIQVKEQKPWTFAVSLSNAGTAASGHDRFTVSGGHTNLWDLDHQFVAAYTTSLENPSDVNQLGLAYKIPLYAQGGVIGVSYTRSDVVGNFGTFTSTGAGHTAGINYTHYLEPNGGRRSWVTLSLDDRVFNAVEINGLPIGYVDRRSRPVTVGYTARTETDAYVWSYSVDLEVNTVNGDNNNLSSYRQEYPGIDTAAFKAVHGSVSYLAPFGSGWTWNARAAYQYSPDALIAGEQFGLGGIGSVRGTSVDRPIAGDKGVAATLEVTTPELAEGLRALGFIDAGWIWNNNADNVNRMGSDSIASIGVGLRYAKGQFAATADYGRIVKGSKMPLAANSSAPQNGDDRFYVSVSYRF